MFIYMTGFCLLPKIWETLINRYGELEISSPSNSHRPGYSSDGYHFVGLKTPTIVPMMTANTKSAFAALSPFSFQYFLVHSYKLGCSPEKLVLVTFKHRTFSLLVLSQYPRSRKGLLQSIILILIIEPSKL